MYEIKYIIYVYLKFDVHLKSNNVSWKQKREFKYNFNLS